MDRPLKPTVMMAVSRLQRTWDRYIKSVARSLGIADPCVRIILFLSHHPGADQKRIAAFDDVTTAAVNRTVREMERDGYLRKEIDAADRRYTRLWLTEKGETVADRLLQKLREADALVTREITPETEDALVAVLDRITDRIREETPSC